MNCPRWNRHCLSFLAVLCCAPALPGAAISDGNPSATQLERNFRKPPASAHPWVYWFWLNGNITSNGVTADLEAMKRVGIAGVLIMEVDQGAPVGPVDFMGRRWRDLFKHVHAEARRLGLAVNMNNDAGWNGSGGPWITPEQSMQEVVWSETNVAGPRRFEATLAQPPATAGFYRDIAVQAFPGVDGYRIPGIEGKAAFQRRGQHQPARGGLSAASVIAREGVTDLTARMDAAGRLVWDVPAGEWTVVRFGHTSTGVENAPAPSTGRGLECDKLSQAGIEANFAGMMAKLAEDNRLRPGPAKAGLVATHIDSWENGSQNWTARMREEFQRRRGYDLTPFLPVFTGRVVGSADISERFLRDLRQTVSELVIENYAGHFRKLAHAAGMRFTVEAYGGPCDAIPYAGESDEPMGEFWTPGGGAMETCRGMASAGHVYGKRIIGAEAFTAGDHERWREHPALLKPLGDRAFCEGINRFVFHRYAMQPWTDGREPGMTMGPWGQHYERTQTWWDWTPGWHTYLARCQYLLQQGRFVADICHVQPEAPPQGPGDHPRTGYAWDECTAHAVLTRMSVKAGRIVLPGGMSYRVLALPATPALTPQLLRKVRELVAAGATVIGPKPSASPSLSGYPQCDAEVQRLAQELWEEGVMESSSDGKGKPARRAASAQPPATPPLPDSAPPLRRRVVGSDSPEQALAAAGVPPDFSAGPPLRFIHRATGDADIYFVANGQPHGFTTTCSFRVTGKAPELWWPDSGRVERAAMWQESGGLTRVVVPFEAGGSVFVVFRERARHSDAVVLVRREGEELLSATPPPPVKIVVRRATYGVPGDAARTRDVTERVQRLAEAGEWHFPASRLAQDGDPAPNVVKTLAVEYEIEGREFRVTAQDPLTIHLTRDALNLIVEKARYGVLADPARTRDVRARVQRLVDAGESSFKVARMAEGDDPAFLVVKTLELEYTLDGQPRRVSATDPDTIDLLPAAAPPLPPVSLARDRSGRVEVTAREPGEYELVTASGATRRVSVSADTLPAPVELDGPWVVRFPVGRGAPAEATFERLQSWSEHRLPGVKYFSGTATYLKSFVLPAPHLASRATHRSALQLDLGNVAVMAEVKLNGRSLGTLWKPPFTVEITDAVKAGVNELEVRVVNRWPNRMIGDEWLAEDSERNPDGTLKRWPQWLLDGQPSPTGRFTFTSWRLWKQGDAPLESGLLGPVRLRVVAHETL